MKKLFNLFTLQEIKGILLRLAFLLKGKIVIYLGLGLISVSFWETVLNAVANYFNIPFEYINNPIFGTVLVIIGLIYEYLYNKKVQEKIYTSVKRIEKDFSEGRFSLSIEDLNSYLIEYEKNGRIL